MRACSLFFTSTVQNAGGADASEEKTDDRRQSTDRQLNGPAQSMSACSAASKPGPEHHDHAAEEGGNIPLHPAGAEPALPHVRNRLQQETPGSRRREKRAKEYPCDDFREFPAEGGSG